MALASTITEELLDTVGVPAELAAVLQRHTRSKGPLYAALAKATAQLRRWLEKLRQETSKLENRRKRTSDQVEGLEERRTELDGKIKTLAQQVEHAETRLSEVDGFLAQTGRLARLGFGEEELVRLSESSPGTWGCSGPVYSST